MGGCMKKMENMNLERGRAYQEMEMKMKWDNFGEKAMENENLDKSRGYPEMEMEMKMKMKMKWDGFDEKTNYHEIEAKNKDFDGEGSYQETGKEEEDECGERENLVCDEINNCVLIIESGYNKNMPPVDDVCPICFDRFTVPCKSNCGHWFCASCILELWAYRSSIRPCKCPLCLCIVVNLKPETSLLIRPTGDTVKVLRKVEQYNGLFVSGVHGFFRRLLALPLLAGRIFSVLIHPDGLRCIYYVTRLLGLLLALLYERGEYEFVPSGGLGIQRTFDMAASLVVLILFVFGVGYRWMLRSRRARRREPEWAMG